MVNVGDNVWVKCGINGDYEELAVVQKATKKKIAVKYIVSGITGETDREHIRPMEDSTMVTDVMKNGEASGRRVRRSTRNSSTPANVTPTPTEIDSDTKSAEGITVAKAKGGKKRKEAAITATAETANKKKKAKGKVESPFFSKIVEKEAEKKSPYFDGTESAAKTKGKSESSGKKKGTAKKGRKLIMASSDDDVEMKAAAKKSGNRKKATAAKNDDDVEMKAAAKKPASRTKAAAAKNDDDVEMKAATKNSAAQKKAAVAKNDDDVEMKAATKKPAAQKKAAVAKNNDDVEMKAAAKKPAAQKKPAAKKRKTSSVPLDDPSSGMCQPCGNVPDGNGGLNKPAPYIVEYSKTGRATCRTCDDRIAKGELRVGHTPLFRGKPGYMVFRHLHCTVFSEEIVCAEDVENYEDLTDEDYVLLAKQVETSKEKIKEEMEELSPDELVQKAFQGEIRTEPPGLTANLLPFQIEGFSWMRHQEVEMSDIRGGILADEMGLGKTIQTISTILDHRPMLQHCKPGMKHPPTGDLKARQDEEQLWEKVATDWTYEMDVLKVGKKLRPRDGGARAGTLVICPVIALTQWKEEILKFTDGSLSVCTYHGPDREKETPRELMKKYDVVLTTYQVLESDFRKMTSPNRVECPNCGGKFKIDKLPIHLKYFCGENAQRTEAQSRQRRNNDRVGGNGRHDGGTSESDDDDDDNGKGSKHKTGKKTKSAHKSSLTKKVATKKARSTKTSKQSKEPPPAGPGRKSSARKAATQAATQISRSASDWTEHHGDDSGSDDFQLGSESSSEEEISDVELETKSSVKWKKKNAMDDYDSDSSSSSDDSMLERARVKQREALDIAKSGKKGKGEKKEMGKGKGKSLKGKGKGKRQQGQGKGKGKQKNGKGKKKPDDDDSDDSDGEYSSEDEVGDALDGIDMQELIDKAMAGAKKSPLHSLCWWRIVLDEAHMIKSRSSQTANAAFSLIGVHRWALSGSPIQNRVGEFYSLVRFLRLDPMAYYYCRSKDCNCKSMHYRMVGGICEGCNHGSIQHYSHFNKYVLNPIQRDGYTGDGRRAMFTLKNEVLDKALLRRTKETKAADLELPPRLVEIRPVQLHPVEEDFYAALYTQTAADFNDYVESGTLLNNYAHIFDLLVRMRQSVDHPYLVIHSKKGVGSAAASQSEGAPIANGSVDCDLCHEPPTDRVVSSCCGAAYCKSCVLEFMTTSTSLANGLTCPSCRAAFSIDLEVRADIEDDSALKVVPAAKASSGDSVGMPSLKELQHVATGSILRRINLTEFATSSKIEALTRELVMMRQKSPGSKAIVFSQFVNMLDLIRWRLHSDPYLEDIGLSARALHGGMNVKARDAVLKEFREDNNVRVLLMSLKAGGVALNLTCANYIFLMDPWWNPAAEMQAIDRTHRLGQYRTIHAVRFIAENTVEERILQLQEKKRLVFDGTVGRDAGSLKMLTVDDMKSLFA